MKGFISLLFVLSTFSCSTIKTIDPPKSHVNISHHGKKSYCEEIPRIYSGVFYNLCHLYGEPSEKINVGSSWNNTPVIVIDTAFSAVADTVILPYTITMQSKKGSIKVN